MAEQLSVSCQVYLWYEILSLGKLNETCLISCQRHFILLPGIFHIHFISCPRLFHNQPDRFFIIHFITCPRISHNQPGRFFIVHFIISLGYFITSQVDFLLFISLFAWPARQIFHYLPRLFHSQPGRFFISISLLTPGYFISISLLAQGYFISLPGPTWVLTVSHGLLTVFRVQKRTSKYGNMRFSE